MCVPGRAKTGRCAPNSPDPLPACLPARNARLRAEMEGHAMRYQIRLDVDTDDPDTTEADVDEAAGYLANELGIRWPAWYVDVETERLGT